jgi:hypothetical protein
VLAAILNLVMDLGLPLLIQFAQGIIPRLTGLINIPWVGWIFRWVVGKLGGNIVDWLVLLNTRRQNVSDIKAKEDIARAAAAALAATTKEKHDADYKAWQAAMLNLNTVSG